MRQSSGLRRFLDVPPRPRRPQAAGDRPADGTALDGDPGEPSGGARGFVAALLASCFVVLAAVLALNVLVDPLALTGLGLVPSAVESDRSTKLTLIERLATSPEILVLGSSRSRQAEPELLQQLTGHNGFNTGVTGGTAADAWVFTRFTASRFRDTPRRYIWFVDVGIAVSGINPQLSGDARSARYLRADGEGFGLDDVGTYLSPDATRASIRVLRKCVITSCESQITYRPDGSIPARQLRFLPEQSQHVAAEAAELARNVRASVPSGVTSDPSRYVFFERTLAFMNARGERPVIVLNPIYPTVLAAFEQQGFPARAQSLAYLDRLRLRGFEFVLVNCEDISSWGGLAEDFSNPTHVNVANMRRMLRYVVAHSDGALR